MENYSSSLAFRGYATKKLKFCFTANKLANIFKNN